MIKSSYLVYIHSIIKTKTAAEKIIESIDELKASLYNKRIDLDKKMGELFSHEMKEKIKAYSVQEQINLIDPESFGKFLTDLRNNIKNMPVVYLSIACETTDDMVKEISNWFVEHYGTQVLVDLKCDKSLIAGAVITFDGKEKDFSLKKKLSERYKPEDWKNMIDQVRHKKPLQNSFTPLSIPHTNGSAI